MLTWVVYDISKDRTRSKIADRCLDFGLQRSRKASTWATCSPTASTR